MAALPPGNGLPAAVFDPRNPWRPLLGIAAIDQAVDQDVHRFGFGRSWDMLAVDIWGLQQQEAIHEAL